VANRFLTRCTHQYNVVGVLATATLGMLAVILGAFGAHGLEKHFSEHALQRYHTGVEYQFYHVCALLFISSQSAKYHTTPRALKLAASFFITGILLFSGSLYLYTLTGRTIFGIITPVGGLSFIAGWFSLIIYAIQNVHETAN